MFYSEQLLGREGPLAQVWLAANLERKLSKSQFLQSSITQSTKAIVRATSENDDSEALALRLSGQLLYGVVRIYSRKAKYLLDDVSDALLKLKSAFRSNANSVTLPVAATIVPSVDQLILQDTITKADLLYQEPLVFDDEETAPGKSYANFFGATQASSNQDFDDSIEIPRNKFDDLDDLQNNDGLDIDLNFDLDEDNDESVNNTRDKDGDLELNFDDSIEVGRAVTEDANLSRVDQFDDLDFGGGGGDDGIDFDFDNEMPPLELINEDEENEGEKQQFTQIPKKPKKRTRINTAGQRKIVSDRSIEIPIENYHDASSIIDNSTNDKENEFNTKRAVIDLLLKDNFLNEEISGTLLNRRGHKRQKTLPTPPGSHEEVPELINSDEETAEAVHQSGGYNFEFEDGIDLDLGYDDERVLINDEGEADAQVDEEENKDDFVSGGSKDGVSESTIKISAHLRELVPKKGEAITFSKLVEQDALAETPLSSVPKSEATRVFFELLVLGTGNAVSLKQTELFGEIKIESRSALFNKFL